MYILQAAWLPVPLCYCAELFQSVTCHDLYLLLNVISDFIKVHFTFYVAHFQCCVPFDQTNLQQLRGGDLSQLKGNGMQSVSVLKVHCISLTTQILHIRMC